MLAHHSRGMSGAKLVGWMLEFYHFHDDSKIIIHAKVTTPVQEQFSKFLTGPIFIYRIFPLE